MLDPSSPFFWVSFKDFLGGLAPPQALPVYAPGSPKSYAEDEKGGLPPDVVEQRKAEPARQDHGRHPAGVQVPRTQQPAPLRERGAGHHEAEVDHADDKPVLQVKKKRGGGRVGWGRGRKT